MDYMYIQYIWVYWNHLFGSLRNGTVETFSSAPCLFFFICPLYNLVSAFLLFDIVLMLSMIPCRSVSTGRLSEQPIRITLGGQAYQGSTDSLNTERPMDTGMGTLLYTLMQMFTKWLPLSGLCLLKSWWWWTAGWLLNCQAFMSSAP